MCLRARVSNLEGDYQSLNGRYMERNQLSRPLRNIDLPIAVRLDRITEARRTYLFILGETTAKETSKKHGFKLSLGNGPSFIVDKLMDLKIGSSGYEQKHGWSKAFTRSTPSRVVVSMSRSGVVSTLLSSSILKQSEENKVVNKQGRLQKKATRYNQENVYRIWMSKNWNTSSAICQ